jgi:hypothetical protein
MQKTRRAGMCMCVMQAPRCVMRAPLRCRMIGRLQLAAGLAIHPVCCRTTYTHMKKQAGLFIIGPHQCHPGADLHCSAARSAQSNSNAVDTHNHNAEVQWHHLVRIFLLH